MWRLLLAVLSLSFLFPPHQAQAQSSGLVVAVCGTLPLAYRPGAQGVISLDVNGNTCIAGTFSATGGTISNATDNQATTATNQGAVAYNYGFNGVGWDRLQVDASKFLKVNCAAGCTAGTASNATSGQATSATNGQSIAWLYGFNGATWDQLQVDASKSLKINCVTGCGSGPITIASGGVASGAYASGSLAVGAGSDGWDVTQGAKADAACGTDNGTCSELALIKRTNQNLTTLNTTAGNPIAAGTNTIGNVNSASQYPVTAVPYTASATGTTAATTATLTGAASVTTYLCGFSIRANATAAATGNATVTGTITGTLNFTQWTAPNASGLGVTEMIFTPCVPASATNTSIAVVSAAPGTGGVVSVSAWGYKL